MQKLSISWGLFILLSLGACREDRKLAKSYIAPAYSALGLYESKDSLYFPLAENTYNNIRSFNYFSVNDKEYIGLYDKMSVSYIIYDLNSCELVRRIKLDSCIRYKNLAKHTTVFCKNFDSLLIINELTMYLLDRDLNIKDSVDFQTEPIMAFGSFGTGTPPLIIDKKIYLSATPFLSRRKKRDIRNWRVLYQVDMSKHKASLTFKLPDKYLDSLYGYYFFGASYCLNDKGRVVLSFPADTCIYESDLGTYYFSYSGKSVFHKTDINAASQEELAGEDGARRAFLLRDSYGEIFFDFKRKRYLRIAEHRLTEREYLLGKREKKRSVIFLDENFRIIGESEFSGDIALSTLFITRDGIMYARKKIKDEYGVHFARLEYRDSTDENILAAY